VVGRAPDDHDDHAGISSRTPEARRALDVSLLPRASADEPTVTYSRRDDNELASGQGDHLERRDLAPVVEPPEVLMELWMWIVLGVVAALALFAALAIGGRLIAASRRRRQRREELAERFGLEYDRTVEQEGRKQATAVLEARVSTYEALEHPTLGPSEREDQTLAWREAQFRFVDSPGRAVREAEHIVVSVMDARGYPTDDAAERADALSVEQPDLANSYRTAHRAYLGADRGTADVAGLLGAFLAYRELLEFLLARPQREASTFDAEPPPRDSRSSDSHPSVEVSDAAERSATSLA
jgi:hypothetical protein